VISGSTANANVVLGNQIGARNGTNNGDAGVLITDGAYQNTVGGVRNGALTLGRGGNTIGGNAIGVHLRAGANNNTVWGNDIGRSAGDWSASLVCPHARRVSTTQRAGLHAGRIRVSYCERCGSTRGHRSHTHSNGARHRAACSRPQHLLIAAHWPLRATAAHRPAPGRAR
jgi:hypothetical protein